MSLSGARILVADDQPDVARTLTSPLRAGGALLRFVGDGQQAMEAIRAGGIDLLIADMKMPPNEWGGLWLLEQLQQHQIEIPTLVLSGEGQQRQTIQAMRFGARTGSRKAGPTVNWRPIARCSWKLHSVKEWRQWQRVAPARWPMDTRGINVRSVANFNTAKAFVCSRRFCGSWR